MVNIKGFFDNVRERIADKAEENFIEALPLLVDMIHDYAEEEMKKRKKTSMTGNFINSFGVALYRDGKFVAVSTTNEIEGREPIQVTLANGDTFGQWKRRYDRRTQFHPFTAPIGTHRIFADKEVVKWLKQYPPTKKKGFSFRVASVTDYSEVVGGAEVLLRIADDIENYGGVITEFNLG